MDRRERRSSLKSDGATRTKRISFSGKKSIRVFSNEEEPKTWNNSYEVSDSSNGLVNVMTMTENCNSKADVDVQVTDAYSLKKTDIKSKVFLKTQVPQIVIHNLDDFKVEADLLNTREFIDKSGLMSDLNYENSVDITLMPHELKSKLSEKQLSNGTFLGQPKEKHEMYEKLSIDRLSTLSLYVQEDRENIEPNCIDISCLNNSPVKNDMCTELANSRVLRRASIYQTDDMNISAFQNHNNSSEYNNPLNMLSTTTASVTNMEVTLSVDSSEVNKEINSTEISHQTITQTKNYLHTDNVDMVANSLKSPFQLCTSKNTLILPDLSSPLLPDHLITNNNMNFRQLNDEIEHGTIQIFADTPSRGICGTPFNSKKKNVMVTPSLLHKTFFGRTLHFHETIANPHTSTIHNESRGKEIKNITTYLTAMELDDESMSLQKSNNSTLQTVYDIPMEECTKIQSGIERSVDDMDVTQTGNEDIDASENTCSKTIATDDSELHQSNDDLVIRPICADQENLNSLQSVMSFANEDFDIEIDSSTTRNVDKHQQEVDKNNSLRTQYFNNDVSLDSVTFSNNSRHIKDEPSHQRQSALIGNILQCISQKEQASFLEDESAILEDSLKEMLKEARAVNKRRTAIYTENNDVELTIVPNTPHRSIIEFEHIENEIKMEDDTVQNCTKVNGEKSQMFTNRKLFDISGLNLINNEEATPLRAFIGKRLTVNMTPNLPQSKRRQTLFLDSDLEESSCSNGAETQRDDRNNTLKDNQKTKIEEISVDNEHEVVCLQKEDSILSESSPLHSDVTTDVNNILLETIQMPRRANTRFLSDDSKSAFLGNITISDVSRASISRVKDLNCIDIEDGGDDRVTEEISIPAKCDKDDIHHHLTDCPMHNDNTEVAEYCNDDRKDLASPATSTLSDLSIQKLENVSQICRKCKQCQETFVKDVTSDSFVLPKLPDLPSVGLEQLKTLHKRPTIADVNEYWRRKSLERSYTLTDISTGHQFLDIKNEKSEDETDDADSYIANYKKSLESIGNRVEPFEQQTPFDVRNTFYDRFKNLLRKKSSNWILNNQMQSRKLMQLRHKKITCACIAIDFEETDIWGRQIKVTDICLQQSRFLKKNWKPIDFIMYFHLNMAFPFDLQALLHKNGEHNLVEILEQINQEYLHVAHMAKSFWKLICSEAATLVRESNGIFVRKIVRDIISPIGEYPRIERIEFRIHVTSIQKICFNDIESPPLHSFREDIQFLPTGLEFLRIFLKCPKTFLKSY